MRPKFLLLLIPVLAMAQDLSMFSGLRWRNIGPLRGGRSVAVAGSASRPLEYYFGATGGGLWKTADGGVSWNPVSDGFFESSSVGAVAVAPSNPDIVYAGMGETELRGNIIQGDGLYKSTDGGKTWAHAGLEHSMAIARIRVDASNPDLVYVAAFGDPYGKNPERGVFRSADGGKSWQKILYRDEKTGAIDLAIDPHNAKTLYASLWEAFRTPYSLSSGGPGSGFFKSTDGGDHWTELTHNPGVPGGVIGKITIAVSADPRRLYALIEAQDGGLFRSDDAGATWALINNGRNLWQRAFYFHRVYADPVSADTVYVSNYELNRSTDGGKTFKIVPAPHADHHDFWIAPTDPNRMIDSNDGGANVSVNAGRTWTAQTFSTAQMYHVVTTKHVPYQVCGAQQDNTTLCVPSNGRGDSLYPVGGGESGYVASDPRNTNIFYAGSFGGYITRYDHSTHQQRDINVWPEYPVGQSAEDLKERFQWTTPIVFSPVDPRTLYTSSQHLFKTTNEGQTWTVISPDLTRHDPSTLGPSGGPITHDQTGVETYGTIFTVAPSRLDGNLIWTGSDDGMVYVTRDGGKNWSNVTPPEIGPLTRISLIEASPQDRATAYIAANRYQAADRGAYVYRTSDFGKTWTKITTGIAPGDFARSIREDTARRSLLYLGTEHGFYISFDAGGHWQPFRLNLPVTPVHDITVEANDLVIATHGRGFYILDNIGSLRQFQPEITQAPAHLFKPSDATRSVTRAAIDYYLASASPDLQLEILDSSGVVVRSFKAGGENSAAAADADDGPPPPARTVPAKKGLNRFSWDLRSAPSHDFPGLIMYQASVAGPFVPPGEYTVKLTAAGLTQSQTFRVLRDARLTNITDTDLAEQYRFARDVQAKFSLTNDTVSRIRRIKSDVADRITRAGNPAVTSSGQKLAADLTDIEGRLYQYRNRATKDPLNFPPQLNNKLGSLLSIVESADAPPTDSSRIVYKQLSDAVDREVSNLADLLGRDLSAFNKALAASQLPPVPGM
jgi:photosystem II stability/assembly factor-like uncharacterized protein